MYGTEDKIGLLPLLCGNPSTELLDARRSVGMVCGRHHWSCEKNLELMRCYYSAKTAGKGYQKCLKSLWDSRNPDKIFSRSINNLSCQARAVLNSKLLSEFELCEAQQCTLVTVDIAPSTHDGNSEHAEVSNTSSTDS